MSRVILVSNRLPVTIKRSREGQTLTMSSGGLVTGLAPLHAKSEGLWIGYPGERPDEQTLETLKQRRLVPVDIPPRSTGATTKATPTVRSGLSSTTLSSGASSNRLSLLLIAR